ncbi:MAG: pseudouridine synthase [Candidatus Woesearchaeota archaeon]
MERVQKIIARRGYTSRRKAEELISEGRVAVNGRIVSLGDQAEDSDEITVDGAPITPQKLCYLAYHKPVGLVTALTDAHEKTIFDDLTIPERVVPVGRLDKWTSGLLILTNDGDFANRIAHPRYELEKEYVLSAPHPLSDSQLDRIRNGLVLDDGPAKPVAVRRLDEHRAAVVLHEGRNRIVRRMAEAVGIKLNGLVRVRIGSLVLGDLEVGAYRELSIQERDALTSG